MTKSQRFLNLIEQIDDENDNMAPPAMKLAGELLKGLNIKPKVGKAKPLPIEETVTIKQVDGEEVRDEHDQDFTEGGNGGAYPEFIPEDEIWWEAGHPLEGNLGNISHEFIERLIMFYLGWDYESAHVLCANPIEAVVRWAARNTHSEDVKESLLKGGASPEVERWIKIFDEAKRKGKI